MYELHELGQPSSDVQRPRRRGEDTIGCFEHYEWIAEHAEHLRPGVLAQWQHDLAPLLVI